MGADALDFSSLSSTKKGFKDLGHINVDKW